MPGTSEAGDKDWWGDQSGWKKSGTACAVAFLALLVVCGGVMVYAALNRSSTTTTGTAGGAGVATATASSTIPAMTPTVTAAAQQQSAVSPAPGNVRWLQVGLGALPFSATSGPARVAAGVPGGFAHTRPGAVMAAVQVMGRLSWAAASRATMHTVATQMTTPAARAVAALTYGPPTDPSNIPTVAGFQIVTYSPDQALVNVALSFNATLRDVPCVMRWVDGDWRLAGAPGPLTTTNWAELDDLTGYVLFSGTPAGTGS